MLLLCLSDWLARCAIQTMGDLATTYGYYGAQWDGNMDDIIAEAGEVSGTTQPVTPSGP